MYNMDLGFNPKWVPIICIPLGIILGIGLIFMGYQMEDDFFIYFGIMVMIFLVGLSILMYYLFKRQMNEIKSEMGIDLGGILDMDRGSTTGGVAEVMSVETTGEYVNNQPEFILLLRITASGEESFEIEHKQAFSDESSVSIGAKIPVMFDKNRNVQLIGIGDVNQYKVIDPTELLK